MKEVFLDLLHSKGGKCEGSGQCVVKGVKSFLRVVGDAVYIVPLMMEGKSET